MALIIAMPLLTTEAIAIGIGASYIIGVFLLGIDPTYSWTNMLKYTNISDVCTGLFKSVIYGGIIALVGCYKGLCCGEGAEGVGRSTTEAVVYSSITILISNFFLTLTINQVIRAI
jgi:phospholipid/cholesterol/gamma-HCH transport system permease protein